VTTFFVSRHPGALEWAAQRGIPIDHQVEHLDVSAVRPGDSVIGTLPVNLAAGVGGGQQA
jgi:CRISPR-associated protein Csx16